MSECGHHRRRAGTGHPLVLAHQRQLAEFVPDARIGERLDREDDVEVGRISDGVVQADRRVARWNEAIRRPPGDAPDRHRLRVDATHALPPRWASRYWRTTNRSATWPPSM